MPCQQVRGAITRLWMGGQAFRFIRADTEGTQNPMLADVSQDTIRGSLDPHDDDIVADGRRNRLLVRMQPNPKEFTALMPFLGLSNGGAGTTYNLVTDVSTMEFEMYVDRDQSGTFHEVSVVDKVIFRSQKGPTPLTIDLAIMMKDEESVADLELDFPAFSLLPGKPYVHKNSVTTLGGNVHKPNFIAWGLDHHRDEEYNASETAEEQCPATREMFLATSTPFFTANELALYTGPRDTPDTGIAGSVAFVRAGATLSFTFGRLRSTPKPPAIMSRLKEVRNGLFYKIVRTDATPLLVVVSDDTE